MRFWEKRSDKCDCFCDTDNNNDDDVVSYSNYLSALYDVHQKASHLFYSWHIQSTHIITGRWCGSYTRPFIQRLLWSDGTVPWYERWVVTMLYDDRWMIMMIDDRWMLDDEMWRSCDHNNGNWCEIFLQSSLLSSQSTITITYTGTVRDWSSFTALAHRYLIIMRPLSSNYTDNVTIYLIRLLPRSHGTMVVGCTDLLASILLKVSD